MTPETAIAWCLLIPFLGAIAVSLLGRWPNLREAASLLSAASLFALVCSLWRPVSEGLRPSLTLAPLFGDHVLKLTLEPLGLLFALIASGLWIVTTIYSIGYMRANGEKNQTRYYASFALALAAAMGVAMAGNLVTLFLFYELLTLSTYPLVTHHGTPEAKRSGRIYLGILLGTSIVFFLLAIIWTQFIAGTSEFRLGGILDETAGAGVLMALYALFLFGIGKAALMPFHRWLPEAMVAPAPVSALLHAVAVVKAGVFSVLKITVYVFGPETLAKSGAAQPMLWVAAFTMLAGGIIAMRKDNLKARLAYSTISQLSYVVIGAALATPLALMGAAFQILMHAVAKITLFFCAGAIYTAAHKANISDFGGLARRMPITFGAFLIAALSIMGLPPFGGFIAKWYLMLGAVEAEQMMVLGVLVVSSLLSVAYLMPVPGRAFLKGKGGQSESGIAEAPLLCLVAIGLTALGCIALFVLSGFVVELLMPVMSGRA